MDDSDKCLRRLMKYPPVENIRDMLTLALNEKANYDKKRTNEKTPLNPLTKGSDPANNSKKAQVAQNPLSNSSFGFPTNFMESSVAPTSFTNQPRQDSPQKKAKVVSNNPLLNPENPLAPSQSKQGAPTTNAPSPLQSNALISTPSLPQEKEANSSRVFEQRVNDCVKDLQKVINRLEHEYFLYFFSFETNS